MVVRPPRTGARRGVGPQERRGLAAAVLRAARRRAAGLWHRTTRSPGLQGQPVWGGRWRLLAVAFSYGARFRGEVSEGAPRRERRRAAGAASHGPSRVITWLVSRRSVCFISGPL
jgi:hypothetical protein